MKTWTTSKIVALKGQRRLACLTAYDATTGRLVDQAGLPLVLVGDSLGMTVLGYGSTLPVTMEQMLHHTAAVCRGVREALVVADMPFLSYQVSISSALANAGRFLQEAGADAVKIEGGSFRAPLVAELVRNGIPVMGHIGLTPQSVLTLGGYKTQGRTEESVAQLLRDTQALVDAGIFALVLECVPPAVAERVTRACPVPVIGIGAGGGCDGQVLVLNDLLGLTDGPVPSFVKAYASLAPMIRDACVAYAADVESGRFPVPAGH